MKEPKKIALITGASRGLGFEICVQLGMLGHQVILGVREPKDMMKKIKILKDKQVECSLLELDMGNISSIENAVLTLTEKYSSLDVLVNNAGTFEEEWGTLPSELDFTHLKRTFDVNF